VRRFRLIQETRGAVERDRVLAGCHGTMSEFSCGCNQVFLYIWLRYGIVSLDRLSRFVLLVHNLQLHFHPKLGFLDPKQ